MERKAHCAVLKISFKCLDPPVHIVEAQAMACPFVRSRLGVSPHSMSTLYGIATELDEKVKVKA